MLYFRSQVYNNNWYTYRHGCYILPISEGHEEVGVRVPPVLLGTAHGILTAGLHPAVIVARVQGLSSLVMLSREQIKGTGH